MHGHHGGKITLSVLVLFLLRALIFSQAVNPDQQQNKIALIIGNGNYTCNFNLIRWEYLSSNLIYGF